jgi:type II restriction enzyme
MSVKGNKGEWSEFYAFIKILSDGKMNAAGRNTDVLPDKFFNVLKIIREEAGQNKKFYDISRNDEKVHIKDDEDEPVETVELDKVKKRVRGIFEEMKNASGSSFELNSAETLMNILHCSQIKASSSRKSDLKVIIHDRISPEEQELGFSIKSMLGSPSTLLNASRATNFVYKINNFESGGSNGSEVRDVINSKKLREKPKIIYGAGGDMEFYDMESEIFKKNLRKIDSQFPLMMAEMMKYYFEGKGATIPELVDLLAQNEEVFEKLGMDKDDYKYKVKKFLSAVALGMMPGRNWDGYAHAHGGYIIVREDGEVVCYHLYILDEFEEYLYRNTKLDTPSTSRHGFGKVYEEDGITKIKYNLQIRFIK